MSNIIIYLPNEPLGKQGGMEKATHQLACLLRDSGHNVSLLCQQKNRLNVPYRPPVPLIFIPQKLNKKEKGTLSTILSAKNKQNSSLTRRKEAS